MLTAYLFCVSAAVVAANPVFQRIPVSLSQACPSQAAPALGFPATASFVPACPSQTCTSQALPPPCQACQANPLQNLLSTIPVVVRPPSNNCPCSNPAPVQNHVINQPVNQDAINQLVLSKLLNPQLQTLSNPGRKACNQCEPQPAVPNIINNYIIIPPEYYKANETSISKVEERGNHIINSNGNCKRKQNQQMDPDSEAKFFYDLILKFFNSQNGGNVDTSELETYIEQRRKSNRPGKHKTKTDETEPMKHPNSEKREGRKTSGNTQINTVGGRKKNPEYIKDLEEAIVQDFCLKNPTIPENIARSLLANVISQILNQGHLSRSSYAPIGYTQYNPRVTNTDHKVGETPTERGPVRKGRRQRRPKKNRYDRRNQVEKETQDTKQCEKCDTTVELNPTILDIEQETITTEKITTTTENNVNRNLSKKVLKSEEDRKKDLVDKLEEIKDKFAKLNEIETTTVNYNRLVETFPELGKEDKVPTFYDNGVEEYFPDFRGDIPYYANDEELDRYHYTTDRNEGTEGKRYVNSKKHESFKDDNSEQMESPNLSDAVSEYTLPIPIEEDSLEDPITNKDTEVQFRTPPFLELPDFKTRKINRNYNSEEINDKFVADDTDKASVYSEFKNDYRVPGNDLRGVKVFSKDKKGKTSIETVLGHSKVVKYGQDSHDEDSKPAIVYYLPEDAMTADRIQLPEGDDAIVVAKSIWDL